MQMNVNKHTIKEQVWLVQELFYSKHMLNKKRNEKKKK